MNAIAFNPVTGELCDPFGGQNDIRQRVIGAVGNAEMRFREDGLRMLRACRFAATLGFELAPGTALAITDRIPFTVAEERICDEWRKALMADKPSTFFQVMAETGLLERIVPEMLPMIGCSQNRYHEFDVWNHTLAVLDACPAELTLRLAAVFHDIAKPQTKGAHPTTGEATFYEHEKVGVGIASELLERLRFSNDERLSVMHFVRHHLVQYESSWSASTIRRWVRRVGSEYVKPLLQLARADIVGKGNATVELNTEALDELEQRIGQMTIREPIVTSTTQLALSGRDVMDALGIGPGPAVGDKLRELLELVTDDPELNTREHLLATIASQPKSTST